MSLRLDWAMDTRVLVAIILVAGVAGGFASNYVGDYYSDDSNDVEETQTSMSEVTRCWGPRFYCWRYKR